MQGFEKFEGNPFQGILASLGNQSAQNAPQQNTQLQSKPAGNQMPEEDNQLMKGKGAGNSQFLLGAVQQIQRYITNSTDPTEIQVARNIVLLLNRLIEKEQQSMMSKIGKDSQTMQNT